MTYENKFGLVRLLTMIAFLVLLLLNNKYPTQLYLSWKSTIIDAYAVLFLVSYYKVAKEYQQMFIMKLGDINDISG